jgi:hypothetical protein
MSAIFNISQVPLVTEKEFYKIWSEAEVDEKYLTRPIFQYLPDLEDRTEEEKAKYPLKDLREEPYLVGMEIVSPEWINRAFCSHLFEWFGLILDEANPIVKRRNSYQTETEMVYIKMEHLVISPSPDFTFQLSHQTPTAE